jgi:hypothetical protein
MIRKEYFAHYNGCRQLLSEHLANVSVAMREAKMGVADYGLSVLLALLLVGSAAARLAGYGLM